MSTDPVFVPTEKVGSYFFGPWPFENVLLRDNVREFIGRGVIVGGHPHVIRGIETHATFVGPRQGTSIGLWLEPVHIEAVDRRAAWPWNGFHCLPDGQMTERWNTGYYDNMPEGDAIRAFARHRALGRQTPTKGPAI